MDEGGRLKGVVAALAPKVGGGAAAKLLVDQGDQPVARFLVAVAPGPQQLRDFVRGSPQTTSSPPIFPAGGPAVKRP